WNWNSGKTEADEVGTVRRRAPGPARRPAEDAGEAPAAAPEHPDRAPAGSRPFPDVAVQVVDPKAVRLVRAHFRGAARTGPLGSATSREVAIEVGLRGRKVVGGPIEVEIESAFFPGTGRAPTRIFPLFLGRQAVHPSTTSLFLLIGLLDEFLSIFPRHLLHRELLQVSIGDRRHLVLTPATAGEPPGVASNDSLPLSWRHGVAPQVDLVGNCPLLASRLPAAAAHPEGPARHQDERHADAVGQPALAVERGAGVAPFFQPVGVHQ